VPVKAANPTKVGLVVSGYAWQRAWFLPAGSAASRRSCPHCPAPSRSRRERGTNTAQRPKNGRPNGLSNSLSARPFNAPQARGRSRRRPRPSPRLLGGRGIFSTRHAPARKLGGMFLAHRLQCGSPSVRAVPVIPGKAALACPSRGDPGFRPNYRTAAGARWSPFSLICQPVDSKTPERMRFAWLSIARKRSSRYACYHCILPQDRVLAVPQMGRRHRAVRAKIGPQTTPKSQSRGDHHTVDNSGDARFNPLSQILFFGVLAPTVGDSRPGKSYHARGAATAWPNAWQRP
jgi:hypothetical protein